MPVLERVIHPISGSASARYALPESWVDVENFARDSTSLCGWFFESGIKLHPISPASGLKRLREEDGDALTPRDPVDRLPEQTGD